MLLCGLRHKGVKIYEVFNSSGIVYYGHSALCNNAVKPGPTLYMARRFFWGTKFSIYNISTSEARVVLLR